MFNKEVKQDVKAIKELLIKANITHGNSLVTTSMEFDEVMQSPGEIKLLLGLIHGLQMRISRAERKFDALCELLSVQQVFPAPGITLGKGSKTVTIPYD